MGYSLMSAESRQANVGDVAGLHPRRWRGGHVPRSREECQHAVALHVSIRVVVLVDLDLEFGDDAGSLRVLVL